MPSTANRDPRDTTASAAWPLDADVVTLADEVSKEAA